MLKLQFNDLRGRQMVMTDCAAGNRQISRQKRIYYIVLQNCESVVTANNGMWAGDE